MIHNISVWETLFSRVFNRLRFLLRVLGLQHTARVVRQLIHFGPWQTLVRRFIRFCRRSSVQNLQDSSALFQSLDSEKVSTELAIDGVSIVGRLPLAFVEEVTAITDKLPPNEYHQCHRVCPPIQRLAEDPALLSILQRHLGCHPKLIEASLIVSKSEKSLETKQQHSFHFDYAGWQSLNVFVYLTDVDFESSYHSVIKQSDRSIRLRDIVKGAISDQEATDRFGDAIVPITGPSGTLFIENTELFHKRNKGSGRRVFLNLCYTSHRNIISFGRASKSEIECRDMLFNRVKASLKPTHID